MTPAPLYRESNMGWFMPVVYFFLGTFMIDALFRIVRGFSK